MSHKNNKSLALGILAVTITAVPVIAMAQTWPTKAVRIINPFPAGGGTDAFARPLAAKLAPYIKSGRMRALAVTSAQRAAVVPDVPTMQEAGFKDFVVTTWYGLWAVKGTPKTGHRPHVSGSKPWRCLT